METFAGHLRCCPRLRGVRIRALTPARSRARDRGGSGPCAQRSAVTPRSAWRFPLVFTSVSKSVASAAVFRPCACSPRRTTSRPFDPPPLFFFFSNPGVEIKPISTRSGLIRTRAGPRGSSLIDRSIPSHLSRRSAKASRPRRRDAVVDPIWSTTFVPWARFCHCVSSARVYAHSPPRSLSLRNYPSAVSLTEALRLLPRSPWRARSW